MPLKSNLLSDNSRLQDCLVEDRAHVTRGSRGDFVTLIQTALILIDDLDIDQHELDTGTYGPSTAAAVLSYKRKRKIINHSYENTEDEIVGKMTIQSLDDEMFDAQRDPEPFRASTCAHCAPPAKAPTDRNIRIGAKLKIVDRFGKRVTVA